MRIPFQKRHQLLFDAPEAIFHPPKLSAGRLYQQEQAQHVTQFVGLLSRFCVPNGYICRRH